MRKIIITIAIIAGGQAAAHTTANQFDALIGAMIRVESAGHNHATGDGGQAVGCLQIWPVMIRDVNRIAGTRYTLADRTNRAKSIHIARIYLAHYCANMTTEQAARCWNGGPAGPRRRSTAGYWRRIQAALAACPAKKKR